MERWVLGTIAGQMERRDATTTGDGVVSDMTVQHWRAVAHWRWLVQKAQSE